MNFEKLVEANQSPDKEDDDEKMDVDGADEEEDGLPAT